MKCIKLFLISLLIGLVMILPTFAANLNKIGVVDFQTILETSKVGKAAQKEIKSEGEKMEETLKEKGAEIEALKKKLERDALVIDRDTRAEREREIRIKINDIKALQKKYMSDFRDLEARMIDRIRTQLIDIIESIGKNEGFLLIMEKNQAGVLYSPGTVDITEKVIRLYNKKVEK
jgi:outer membrane protein